MVNNNSNTNTIKKLPHGNAVPQHIVLKNTPHQNWLLWHWQKGKRQEALRPAEVRMINLRKEADRLLQGQQKDVLWFDSYKQLVGAKPRNNIIADNKSSLSKSPKN